MTVSRLAQTSAEERGKMFKIKEHQNFASGQRRSKDFLSQFKT